VDSGPLIQVSVFVYAMKLSDSCEVLRNYMSDLSRSVGRCTNMEKVLSMELDYTEILP
jgi:hypothetical protein